MIWVHLKLFHPFAHLSFSWAWFRAGQRQCRVLSAIKQMHPFKTFEYNYSTSCQTQRSPLHYAVCNVYFLIFFYPLALCNFLIPLNLKCPSTLLHPATPTRRWPGCYAHTTRAPALHSWAWTLQVFSLYYLKKLLGYECEPKYTIRLCRVQKDNIFFMSYGLCCTIFCLRAECNELAELPKYPALAMPL